MSEPDTGEAPPPVFLDANIFIDILQERSGWEYSLAVVTAVKTGKITGHLSSLTVAVMHYVWKRQVTERRAREDVRNLIEGFDVLALTSEHVSSSFSDDSRKLLSDFEDALQFYCAKGGSVNIIITRNKRHFSRVSGQIEALPPSQKYLDMFKTG